MRHFVVEVAPRRAVGDAAGAGEDDLRDRGGASSRARADNTLAEVRVYTDVDGPGGLDRLAADVAEMKPDADGAAHLLAERGVEAARRDRRHLADGAWARAAAASAGAGGDRIGRVGAGARQGAGDGGAGAIASSSSERWARWGRRARRRRCASTATTRRPSRRAPTRRWCSGCCRASRPASRRCSRAPARARRRCAWRRCSRWRTCTKKRAVASRSALAEGGDDARVGDLARAIGLAATRFGGKPEAAAALRRHGRAARAATTRSSCAWCERWATSAIASSPARSPRRRANADRSCARRR